MAEEQETKDSVTTQIHEIYIKASPEAIWDAITTPEWSAKYSYGGLVEYDLRPGGAYKARANEEMISFGIPEVAVDGEVIESDPPRKLVQTYRFLFSEEHKSEGFTRLTWEIEPTKSGFTRLTVTHELEGAPIMATMVGGKFSEEGGGGWSWILSDLKTLLETGKSMGT
ncbi:MAG TPA: SRPBCC family protein [Thermoanaerobaculia bacterium]|jgi:uncharacterized protein YndB with AHSA1/START domain|nr:SRPBCC family protein [Thermoanaerobaculia bacterium]